MGELNYTISSILFRLSLAVLQTTPKLCSLKCLFCSCICSFGRTWRGHLVSIHSVLVGSRDHPKAHSMSGRACWVLSGTSAGCCLGPQLGPAPEHHVTAWLPHSMITGLYRMNVPEERQEKLYCLSNWPGKSCSVILPGSLH